jgi:hypothetical protein
VAVPNGLSQAGASLAHGSSIAYSLYRVLALPPRSPGESALARRREVSDETTTGALDEMAADGVRHRIQCCSQLNDDAFGQPMPRETTPCQVAVSAVRSAVGAGGMGRRDRARG